MTNKAGCKERRGFVVLASMVGQRDGSGTNSPATPLLTDLPRPHRLHATYPGGVRGEECCQL